MGFPWESNVLCAGVGVAVGVGVGVGVGDASTSVEEVSACAPAL